MERVKRKWKTEQDKWTSLMMHGACSDQSCGRTGKPPLWTDWTDPSPVRAFHVLPFKHIQNWAISEWYKRVFRDWFIVLSLMHQYPYLSRRDLIKNYCFGNAFCARHSPLIKNKVSCCITFDEPSVQLKRSFPCKLTVWMSDFVSICSLSCLSTKSTATVNMGQVTIISLTHKGNCRQAKSHNRVQQEHSNVWRAYSGCTIAL